MIDLSMWINKWRFAGKRLGGAGKKIGVGTGAQRINPLPVTRQEGFAGINTSFWRATQKSYQTSLPMGQDEPAPVIAAGKQTLTIAFIIAGLILLPEILRAVRKITR